MYDFLEEIACHKTFSAHFLEEIARHKTFSVHFLEEIARHKTVSAHFLRKSLATKLFRLISSGNRSPQTFSAHFLRKSAATKLFQPKAWRKSTTTSEKEGIEDEPQENGIFFGLLRDIVEILFACYRNGSIFAAVSWHM